jgi:hypothetical protein
MPADGSRWLGGARQPHGIAILLLACLPFACAGEPTRSPFPSPSVRPRVPAAVPCCALPLSLPRPPPLPLTLPLTLGRADTTPSSTHCRAGINLPGQDLDGNPRFLPAAGSAELSRRSISLFPRLTFAA